MSDQSPEKSTRPAPDEFHVLPPASDHSPLEDADTERQKEAVEHGMMLKSAEMEQRIAALEPESESLKDNLKKLVARLAGLKTSVNSLKKHADSANERLDKLEPGSAELADTMAAQQQKLEELDALGQDMRPRLENGEQRTESLQVEYTDVRRLTEALKTGQSELGDRTRALEAETSELSERAVATSSEIGTLLSLTDGLAERTRRGEERLDKLESRSEALNTGVEALHRVTTDLHDTQREHDDKLDVQGTRLNTLQHNHTTLNRSHDQLSQRADALAERGDQLGQRLRQGAWVAGGVAVVLAVVAATAHFQEPAEVIAPNIEPLAEQVAEVQLNTTLQQQNLSQLNEEISSLSLRMQQTPAGVDPALSSQVQGMDERLTALDSKVGSELVAIRNNLAVDNDTLGAPVDLTTIAGSEWLATQPADHYVIQLGGVYGKRALSELTGRMQKQVSSEELSWFQTQYRGRDWFVLLYGSYASFDEALQAMESLPEGIRATQPYIRSFGGVRESIDK